MADESNDGTEDLMRLTKAELAHKVHQAETWGEQQRQAYIGTDRALRALNHHDEGVLTSRIVAAIDHYRTERSSGSRTSSSGVVAHHYSPSVPEPHRPDAVERALRHAWLYAGLPDPAVECDRLRELLRQARAEAADAEDRLERVRQLGAGEEPSF